jgi:predicted patatin/cPLA2 family phospholipase
MNDKTKSALIVEGGGMRSIFAAGVLHAFGKAGFDPFDLYIGVSAGACHLASHLAG